MSGGKGGKPPAPPDYVGAAREQGQQNLDAIRAGAALNRVNQVGPTGSTTYRNLGGDQWEQTTTLTPNQQNILGQSEQNQIDLGQIAGMRLGEIGQRGQFTLDGLPSRVSNVQSSSVGAPSVEQRQRAEDAVYRSATRQLDPQFQQREETARTRLMNQGVREGSEAWNTEMANMDRERQAAYGDARDRAIMVGGTEASRMLQDDLSREHQRFSAALTNAQLQNEARTTGLNERLTERDVPLREFMSMYGGGYQSPTGTPGVAQVGTPQPGDYQGAVNAQYGAQSDIYNWNQQRNAQNTSALTNLAMMAAIYSDRRLKRDISRVGAMPSGLPLYRFKYRWSDQEYIGVMADEAERTHPHAVTEIDGFKAVDYGALS